jgi:hypothetical protein
VFKHLGYQPDLSSTAPVVQAPLQVASDFSLNVFPTPGCNPDAKANATRRDKRKQKHKNVCFVLNIKSGKKVSSDPVAGCFRRDRKKAIWVPVPDRSIKK